MNHGREIHFFPLLHDLVPDIVVDNSGLVPFHLDLAGFAVDNSGPGFDCTVEFVEMIDREIDVAVVDLLNLFVVNAVEGARRYFLKHGFLKNKDSVLIGLSHV